MRQSALVCAALFLTCLSILAQSGGGSIHGIVVSADGTPIADVSVVGKEGPCCPVQLASTKTDKQGAFTLSNPGRVIHFYKDGLLPLTAVLTSHEEILRAVMKTDAGADWRLPECSRNPRSARTLGYAVKLIVPKHTKLSKTRNTDYTAYSVSYPGERMKLELRWGPLVGGSNDDQLFADSANFSERWILPLGIDSAGVLKNGKRWRTVDIAGVGLFHYESVSQAAALYYDQIISSSCYDKSWPAFHKLRMVR
jgi:hypothetical protein